MKKICLIVFLLVIYSASVVFARGAANYRHSVAAKAKTVISAKMTKVYICPMDQYTSDKPGKCPLCGMNLEETEMSTASAKAALEKSKMFA